MNGDWHQFRDKNAVVWRYQGRQTVERHSAAAGKAGDELFYSVNTVNQTMGEKMHIVGESNSRVQNPIYIFEKQNS